MATDKVGTLTGKVNNMDVVYSLTLENGVFVQIQGETIYMREVDNAEERIELNLEEFDMIRAFVKMCCAGETNR